MFKLKKMNLKLLALLLLFGFLPLFSAQADGGMIPRPSADSDDLYEPSQTGLVVYDQGQEDIYLKANYEGETNDFVWVVPTPNYPEVEEAPRDIFKELSIYTTSNSFAKTESVDAGVQKEQEQTNVIVHEQKQVGIFEVSVLSATGEDGLYQWLEENNYPVTEDIKPTLDWYVEKEWYFTAMRITPGGELKKVIKDLNKEVDTEVTEANLATILANYYKKGLENSDLEQTQKAFDLLVTLAPDDNRDIQRAANLIKEMSPSEFQKATAGEEPLSLTDLTKAKEDIYSWVQNKKSESQKEVDKYDSYIHPIKISFGSPSIVYPLKISRISTRVPENEEGSLKTNEVLLYVLSQEQVKAPRFKTEYNDEITSENIDQMEKDMYSQDLSSLQKIIGDQDHFLTKMRRTFAKKEMDEDLYIVPGEASSSQDGTMSLTESYQNNPKYQRAQKRTQGNALSDRLKGEIVLKTEDKGQAYYVNPTTKYSHYLGRPADALGVMRDQGTGIKTTDLSKIPMSLEHLKGPDSDGDGLPDRFEKAIGTDIHSLDTDQDGYNDKEELERNYDPNKGNGAKLNVDQDFAKKQKGKILLQVENNGEAWYVNPKDGKRYFLGRPADAFGIMRGLGKGISNEDFNKLQTGQVGPDTTQRSCANKECPDGHFCYGGFDCGFGPNGSVECPEEIKEKWDYECHQYCNNSECPAGQECRKFSMSDMIMKGCFKK